jgi:hypothetical protein
MSYTLRYPELQLKDILTALPKAEIKEKVIDDYVIFTILWHEPAQIKDGSDLYSVEVRFCDTLPGPNRGMFINKMMLKDRAYRNNIQLHIDEGQSGTWNGQSLLDGKLKVKGKIQ